MLVFVQHYMALHKDDDKLTIPFLGSSTNLNAIANCV